jgi:hypothetical protein
MIQSLMIYAGEENLIWMKLQVLIYSLEKCATCHFIPLTNRTVPQVL